MFPIRDHNPSNKFPLVTIVLIVLNVLFFLIELSVPDLDVFLGKYALIPQLVHWGDPSTWFPFLSSMFLHGGWLHILSNMWFLWIFGDNIEATLGKVRFVVFYLLSGLAAALLQYAIDPASSIPVLGASGAIAGVLGGYLVLFPSAKIETLIAGFGFLTRVNVPASFMLVYWFAIQLFSGVGSLAVYEAGQGGVAFFAHIGGFVAGWLMIRLFRSQLDWVRIE